MWVRGIPEPETLKPKPSTLKPSTLNEPRVPKQCMGFRVQGPIMENQMEKKMENKMETGVIWGLYWGYSISFWGILVPGIQQDYFLLLGYSIFYKE